MPGRPTDGNIVLVLIAIEKFVNKIVAVTIIILLFLSLNVIFALKDV